GPAVTDNGRKSRRERSVPSLCSVSESCLSSIVASPLERLVDLRAAFQRLSATHLEQYLRKQPERADAPSSSMNKHVAILDDARLNHATDIRADSLANTEQGLS